MKQVTIPAQWLQELIALCGPEDHELRERVMKSAAPAPVDALATGGQAQARSKNGWTFEELEAQLAEATKADPENCRAVGEELLKVIHDNFAALKAIGWDGPVDSPVEVVADLLNLLDEAKAAAPQQADARCLSCNYQHGHAIGCENNPVDIALKAQADAQAVERGEVLVTVSGFTGSGAADRYTKKPVTIDAIRWTGKNLREVIAFTDGPPDTRTSHAGMAWDTYVDLVERDGLKIFTLEGKMSAAIGDWIIKGVQGEHYPCKPDIFEATYSTALAASAPKAAPAAVAVPDGWREQFATEVYTDLEAADNQDVPLEEYPARILKVLDSIVGPRHPAVVQWRNDAIKTCIAIAYKYCRDPDSHKYLKQDLEALLTAEPAPQAQADARDAGRWRMASLIHSEMMKHPDIRAEPEAASAYMKAVHDGVCFEAAIDAAIAAAKGESNASN